MDREDEAWAAVAARWRDDDAHRAYLAEHPSLEGLAEAGRRYRGALDRDPADEVAARWRDEVVRRATVLALAQLPRTRPPPERTPLRRALVGLCIMVLLSALGYAAVRFFAPPPGATP